MPHTIKLDVYTYLLCHAINLRPDGAIARRTRKPHLTKRCPALAVGLLSHITSTTLVRMPDAFHFRQCETGTEPRM